MRDMPIASHIVEGIVMSSHKSIDFVLKTVEERDLQFLRLWFTDVLGNLKAFAISPNDLEEAFDEGVGFDGSAVDGFASLEESDMLAFPDAETFSMLPWRPDGERVARVFCETRTPSREPFEGDPRTCLKRIFDKASDKGFVFNVGPKIEYFYFDNDVDPKPLDRAGYFDLSVHDQGRDLRRRATQQLEKMGIPVQYSYHAQAPSQSGIELRYTEAVNCADNIMTARYIIKRVAKEADLFASFMPKPLEGVPGSAMFLYLSVFDHEGTNLFWAPKEENEAHLSPMAQSFVAGLIKYAPEFMLVTNPTVNSYKRFVTSGEVPIYATWGRKNRSALVRVPTHKPGKHGPTRVELRNPDPTANPYLALAVTLAAGMRGVEEGLEMPPEYTAEHRSMSEAEYAEMGFERLPRSMGEALERFRTSELMRAVLGDHIFNFLLEEKTREWCAFMSAVTDWECKHYYGGV